MPFPVLCHWTFEDNGNDDDDMMIMTVTKKMMIILMIRKITFVELLNS